MNGGVAGPLLDQDPNNLCGADCMGQGGIGYDSITTKRDVTLDDPADSLPLERIYNKGPLLTIAMALFGEGSFVANRVTWPDAYSGINGTRRNAGVCVDMAPLSSLLTDRWGQTKITFSLNRCITNGMSGHGFAGLQAELADWTDNFIDNDERMTNALTAAAFLANKAWILHNTDGHTLAVSYDQGADTQVPVISRKGVITISALLAIYLLALVATAVYACLSPRWTNQLDSFTMMRLGAAIADKIPLMVGRRTDKIKALDEIPGWIGDVGKDEETGRLGLGAPAIVSTGRRYECYEGDHELLSALEQRNLRNRLRDLRAQGLQGAGVTALDAIGVRV
ncbi:hypothetical protein B0A49_09449 [Cryomyces minteri]|uniref:Uncharacterized protein n=1 Tax=Cryomyces minteri TaxID=331657 RepID=A0A4U0X4I1_9PEZI|nr:hypothetical protein B0A49_09449 [Cryomyces minteri]